MDITAQKKMEQSLLEKNLQLQTVIQMLPDLFYFKDMDRRYTIVNKALEDFVGLPAEAILSRHSEDILPAEWANQIRSSDEEAFLTGSLVRQEQQVEGPQQRWLDSFKVPLRDAQGNMIGIIRRRPQTSPNANAMNCWKNEPPHWNIACYDCKKPGTKR